MKNDITSTPKSASETNRPAPNGRTKTTPSTSAGSDAAFAAFEIKLRREMAESVASQLADMRAAMSDEIVTKSIRVENGTEVTTRIEPGNIQLEHRRSVEPIGNSLPALGSFVSMAACSGSAEVQIGADLSVEPGDPSVTATLFVDGDALPNATATVVVSGRRRVRTLGA